MVKKSSAHQFKWVKGYTQNGKRLYRCTCGIEIIAWSKQEAQKQHD